MNNLENVLHIPIRNDNNKIYDYQIYIHLVNCKY